MFPILDCPNVALIGANYTVSQFSFVQYQSTALIPHSDSNINSTNTHEMYYMMYDAGYTYTPTCVTGASFCPQYTVDCNPPYDWTPHTYQFDIAVDVSPTTYDAPIVRDCTGRYLTIYDSGNPLRLPSGNPLPVPSGTTAPSGDESVLFSITVSTNSAQIGIALSAANPDFIGSRSYRFKAKICSTCTYYDRNIYIRANIINSANTQKAKDQDSYNPLCNYDKIYPFLLGHASADVNVTYSGLDPYGNIMLAGFGSKYPFSNLASTALQQGYIALINLRGLPYWVYMIKDVQGTTAANNVCNYMRHYNNMGDGVDYLFVMCNIYRTDLADALSAYKESPMLMKLKHDTGQVLFMRYLPVDSFFNVMQQDGLFAEQISTNSYYAVYRYRYMPGPVQTFAAIAFNADFSSVNLQIYNNADPTGGLLGTQTGVKKYGWFSTVVLSDTNGFYVVVAADQALGTFIYYINRSLVPQNQGKIALATTGSGYTEIQPCQTTSSLIIPVLNNQQIAPGSSVETLYLVKVTKVTLNSTYQVTITHNVNVNLKNVVVTTDTTDQVYVMASESSIVFYKLDANLNVLISKVLKATGTTGYMLANSISNYKDSSLIFVLGGYWQFSTDKRSVAVLRSNNILDFTGFTCGLAIQNFQSWDASWAAPSAPVTISTPTSILIYNPTVPVMTAVTGQNYYMSNWPLMMDAMSVTMQTVTLDTNNPNKDSIGAEKVPNFYKYPDSQNNCYLYEVYKSFLDLDATGQPATFYEFKLNNGSQTIQLTQFNSSVTNCQGRQQKMRITTVHNNASTSATVAGQGWLTFDDSASQISIDTTAPSVPESAQITVRYFDALAGESMGYFDFVIHIRIMAENPITPSDQTYDSLQKCSQNIFPVSYGGKAGIKGDDMISYGFYLVGDDKNMLVSGKTMNSSQTNQIEGSYDGFMMRLTPLGFIQWMSYISLKQGVDEYVGGIVYAGDVKCAYGRFHSNQSPASARISAIVKLTYEEGKMIWAKSIQYQDALYFPPEKITRESGWMIDVDPSDSKRMVISSILNFGTTKGYHPAVTVVKDDGTSFTVLQNYYIKPQLLTNLATIPSVSNAVFQDSVATQGTKTFFGVSHFLDATNIRNLMFVKMDTLTGQINWATMIPGVASLSIETMGQPHLIQRKGKLYTTTVVNTATANQIGCVYVSTFNIADGTQYANKLAVVDTTYQLSNVQLVTDTATISPSGINMFLVATLKNGYYVYIQQVDDSLTFTASALKFHPSTTTPYVDTLLNNHKVMVQAATDSYYIMVNFKQFFQPTNTKVETVIFKQDLNIKLSGMYSCHAWTDAFGVNQQVNTYATTLMTANQIGNVLFQWSALQTLDNQLVRNLQIHNYPDYLYPQREATPVHFYDELLPQTQCQTIQPPQLIEIASLQMTLNDTKATQPVSATSFSQCQNMPVTFSMSFQDSGTAASSLGLDDFILIDQSADAATATVDTTGWITSATYIYPSYRALKVKACNAIYTSICSQHTLPVMIFDQLHDNAAKTAVSRPVNGECLAKTEYPKVMSDKNLQTNAFLGMHIDQVQGNIFICGWSLLNTHKTLTTYPDQGKKMAITLLLNNLGDVYWHYSFRSIKTPTASDLSAQTCMVSASGESMYIMIYDLQGLELSVMKQSYDKGAVQWVRKLPGTFSDIDGAITMEQDYDVLGTNVLYIGPRYQAAVGDSNQWHLYKIDISGVVPRQLWHSYRLASTAKDYQGIDQLGISTNVIMAASFFESTVRRHALIQVDKQTGAYTSYQMKVTGDSKVTSTSATTVFKSQTFVLDKGTGGGIHYAYIEKLDKLRYSLISEVNFAKTYEYEIAIPATTAPWLSMAVDELGLANGYVYLYMASNLPDNYLMYYKKSDGSIQSWSKISGHASSTHKFPIIQFSKAESTKYLYMMFSATYYVDAAQAGVINRIKNDLTFITESCVGPVAQTVPTQITSSAIAAFATPLTATLVGTYLNLYVTDKIYGEIVNFALPLGFGLRSAENIGCVPPPPYFNSVSPNYQILVAASGVSTTRKINIIGGKQCPIVVLLMGSWSVDRFPGDKPSWITVSNPVDPPFTEITGDGNEFTMTPTNTEIGTYAVRVKYYSPVNSGTVEQSFLVDVYPSVDYSITPPTTSCVNDIYPLTLGNLPNIKVLDGDYDGTNFIVCGSTSSTRTAHSTSYNSAYLQSYNKNIMVNYQLIFEADVYQSEMVKCQFANSGMMYMGINSKSTSAAGNFDKIHLYKYLHNQAKFQTAKMLAAKGQLAELVSMVVSTASGDQFYAGRIQSKKMQVNVGEMESFVMRLNTNMDYVFLRTFQGGTTDASALALMFDSVAATQGVYVHIKELVTAGKWAMRLVKLSYGGNNSTGGAPLWGYRIYEPTNLAVPFGRGGLAKDSSSAYSCMVIGNSAGTLRQTLVMKFDASTGARISNLDFSSPQAVDCNVFFHQTSNKLILNMQLSTGTSELINMDLGGVNLVIGSMTSRLRFAVTGYQQLGMTRMFMQGTDVWMFYPSQSTAAGTYSSIFITKMNDVANMNWDATAGCPSIHNQDIDSTLFASYLTASPSFGGDNQDTSAVMVLTASASIASNLPVSTVIEAHIMSPDMLVVYYDTPLTMPDLDLKFSYSTVCSVWARPTPSTLLNRINLGGLSVSADNYTIAQTSFDEAHCQGLSFTYTATMLDESPLLSWMWFDPATITYFFTPNTNDRIGIYDLSMIATLTTNATKQQLPIKTTASFKVQVIINIPPTIDPFSFNLNESIYAHQNWNISVKYENDQESNDPFMDAEFVEDVSGTFVPQAKPSWFTINNATSKELYLELKDPPQPAVPTDLRTLYIIRMRIWDIYNMLTPNYYFVYIYVKNNYPPYMKPGAIDLNLGTIQVPFSYSKTFWYNNFADDENDDILVDCTKMLHNNSITPNWTLCDNNKSSGNITLYGTVPKDNLRTGSYQIFCVVQDIYKDGNYTQYIFDLQVTTKPGLIVSGGPNSVSSRLPNISEVSTLPYSKDVDGLAYRKKLYVNNTIWTNSAYGTWMVWDEPIQKVTITPTKNNQAGLHQMGVIVDDGITTPLWINFTMEVIPNWPLLNLMDLPNRQAIVDNWFFFDFDKYSIFKNPETDLKDQFSMYFRQKDSKPPSLPYFIKFYPNGTIYGLGTQNYIGTYQIECVGVDDFPNWETPLEFTLTVKPCYYKCSACWNTDYNTCLECKKGYFLLNTECNDFCPVRAYADNVLNKCFGCHESCKVCVGADHTSNCSICNTGFYKLNDGCWETCPDGFWGDNQDYYCKPCNEACKKCVGPLSTQCQKCADLFQVNEIGVLDKLGYLLVGTQCQVPKCGDGQYFKWDSLPDYNGNILGQCDSCHETCRKCVGSLRTQCVSCVPGRQLEPETHTCLLCQDINPGFTLNEELECEDRCGDGVIVNKPCDDGNVFNGDGCSKSCYIEFGFVCDTPGKPCREIIPPTFKISANSLTNQHYVEFSEPVLLKYDTTISPENMNVEIIGKKANYPFSWRIIPNPAAPLIPNQQIIKFSFKLYDIMITLTGNELVRVTFNDYNQIQDLAGNLIVNNSFAERNPAPFVYVSSDEANAVAGGGESMKYAFLSAMGFQLGLKVIINGSMQYLWGLVHALQVFQYLLLLNIDFPPNLPAFTSYFSIASGDTGAMGINDYMPDIKKWLINVDDIEGQYDNEILPPKFVEAKISPYFIIAYSDKLNTWILALFILLPILLFLNKVCKKMKVFENMIGGFFFNGPLRTVTEMYFEMVITIVVNVGFVKFRNKSQLIASLTAFMFGTFTLLLPFILMTVIYANRKNVRKRIWMIKFGMLTEEFSQKSITQLYYTPAYLFQRMTFSATIVFLYAYPLLQCFICAVAILSMTGYLVIIRPYKSENQQTTTVVDEIILFVCLLFFVYIYLNQDTMDVDSKKNLGWIIILIMMFSILKNLFVLLYFGFLNMRKKMKAMFSAEDEQLDSPHTSDNNSDTIDSIDTDEIEEDVRKEEYEREEYNERIKARQEERQAQMKMAPQVIQGQTQMMMMPMAVGMIGMPVMYEHFGNPMPMMMPQSQMMMQQHQMMMQGRPQAQMKRGGGRTALPGQLENEEYDPDHPFDNPENATPIGPKDAVKAQKLKQNNFFSGEKSPNAIDHLQQLEEVANADDGYGQEYGAEYYDYGAEYGAEAEVPAEQQEERADWGDDLNEPAPITAPKEPKTTISPKAEIPSQIEDQDELFDGAQEDVDFDQVLEDEVPEQTTQKEKQPEVQANDVEEFEELG